MNLYNKFVSLFRRHNHRVLVVKRDPCRLRMSEFRSDPAMTKFAANIVNHPDFRLMLDVVRTEAPINMELFPNSDITTRALWQARCEGYILAINNLEALAKFEKPHEQLEATFDAPEIDQH